MNHPHAVHPNPNALQKDKDTPALRLVAWETTRNCNLSCVHCRAAAESGPYAGELDTPAAFRLLDQISEVEKPIVILTGGEPLLRHDIFEIAAYGNQKGLRMVMAPNGTLITDENAEKMVASGIKRISISIDGATKEFHDTFRGVKGAFDGAISGIEKAKKVGLEFQINTTVTKTNLEQIPLIQKLAIDLGGGGPSYFSAGSHGQGKVYC